jgi:hypothetical protein
MTQYVAGKEQIRGQTVNDSDRLNAEAGIAQQVKNRQEIVIACIRVDDQWRWHQSLQIL